MIFISNIVAFAKSISIIYTTEFIYIFFIHRTNTMSANTREREREQWSNILLLLMDSLVWIIKMYHIEILTHDANWHTRTNRNLFKYHRKLEIII